MRFSYAESMTDPSYYLPLAQAVEAAGYSSFIIPDSICYPEVSDSTYRTRRTGSGTSSRTSLSSSRSP
jgi:hypothetical protein